MIDETYIKELDRLVSEALQDQDKVLFALSMVVKRSEDNDSLADAIITTLNDEPEYFGKCLGEHIKNQLIEDAAQTLALRFEKTGSYEVL